MKFIFLAMLGFVFTNAYTQNFVPNYDESKIPDYVLPQLLISKDGSKVSTATQWKNKRRNELLANFQTYIYGKVPNGDVDVQTQLIKKLDAFGGKAIMKEVKITFSRNQKKISMNLLIYLPKSGTKVPIFLALNFNGNYTIINDPNISLTTSWVPNNEKFNITDHQATESSRGSAHRRWPVEEIIDHGYGLATIYYGDIDPDKNDFSDGIHPLFYTPGQVHPAKDEWGSISAWAWGLSRAMDYLEKDDNIDPSKVILLGHSRLGKAALWAGATDERFAIVISNESGCGGAAISRRKIGETVARINTSFPHWFCDNFKQFNNNEDALPVDQHMLIALIAPRPVYVASAEGDKWSDPKGEFFSAYYAGKVYQLFGLTGLPNDKMPKVNSPIMRTVGYHIRTGKHDLTDFDWNQYLKFADLHFKK
ncbi:MAG: acetylxylan esterase [Bacteroidota bacterium]|nr:acetylxylan esterase [Bacteroidota bacterium]